MTYRELQVEVSARVGLIQIDRPEALNALNHAVMEEMHEALRSLESDPQVGAIVITGDERAFAAGADIKEMVNSTAVDMLENDPIGYWDRVQDVTKPVIAAVSGWCLGGGCELAMACDMIVASETAVFGQPEINLGVIPGAGGTQRLTRAVGKVIAMEMILNDRHLNADEALQMGLINRVVPAELYMEEALKLAGEIAARAPIALRMAKEMVVRAHETLLADGIAEERRNFYFLFSTEDQNEGMHAFMDKRTAKWKGE